MSQRGRKENRTDFESDKILKINEVYVHYHSSLKSELKRRVNQLVLIQDSNNNVS